MIDDIDAALRNWSDWVRDRHHQGHCISIEHRFRRRSREDDTYTGWGDWGTSPPIVLGDPIDALQALAVERVMRWLPEGHRLALRLHYVDRLPYRMCCRMLHLGYDRWTQYLRDAQLMVGNRLTCAHIRRIGIADNLRPAHAETLSP